MVMALERWYFSPAVCCLTSFGIFDVRERGVHDERDEILPTRTRPNLPQPPPQHATTPHGAPRWQQATTQDPLLPLASRSIRADTSDFSRTIVRQFDKRKAYRHDFNTIQRKLERCSSSAVHWQNFVVGNRPPLYTPFHRCMRCVQFWFRRKWQCHSSNKKRKSTITMTDGRIVTRIQLKVFRNIQAGYKYT